MWRKWSRLKLCGGGMPPTFHEPTKSLFKDETVRTNIMVIGSLEHVEVEPT